MPISKRLTRSFPSQAFGATSTLGVPVTTTLCWTTGGGTNSGRFFNWFAT